MAMSLEDLLAKEGFKRRKAKILPRASFACEGRSTMPPRSDPFSNPIKSTIRTRSEITRKGDYSTSSSYKGIRSREKIDKKTDSQVSEIIEVEQDDLTQNDEIVYVGIQGRYKDTFFNKVYAHEARHINVSRDKKSLENSFKRPPPLGNSNENRSIRQPKFEDSLTIPSLEEAAVKALISILSGHVKLFLENEDFRTSLRHNSFASLNFLDTNEGPTKVIENLEQAIEIIERASEEKATSKELKKASLQLSVITGLNSNDLREGFTSGIPNFKLSACAHLYLSVIYMLQKKDKITAKHVLQVFCDSPFQARTALLPDLWDRVFLPHLVQLKLWYEKGLYSVQDSPLSKNTKFLDKVYNEKLDLATYQFAVYYKDWLTEAVDSPSIPLIIIPSFSVQLMPKGGLHGHASSPASYLSPQPMVSRKLYDEVFKYTPKVGVESEVYEEDRFEISGRSSSSPATEDKQLILYDSMVCTNENSERGDENIYDDLLMAKEENSETRLLEMPTNPMFELQQIDHAGIEPPVQDQQESYQYSIEKTSLSSIPKDFICPLTGLPFKDPVTIETGQTFEREAITDWFEKGFLTCPMTRKILKSQSVPPTNFILKRVIKTWKTEHSNHLLSLLSQITEGSIENLKVNDHMYISILEQLNIVLSGEERTMSLKRIVSIGGLEYLLRRFDYGNMKENILLVPLLSWCIEDDAGCKYYVARNIHKLNLLKLIRSEDLKARTDSVSLMTELICLNRRNEAKKFLEGLHEEEIINVMDDLFVHLETCPSEQTPLVAALLLNLDLLSELHTSNVYRQEAVDSLVTALERSLTDEKVAKKCSRTLLILGSYFSSSGKVMTEDWILKLAGFLHGPDWDITDEEANDVAIDQTVTKVNSLTENGDEENSREKWLVSLSSSLLEDGKNPFLETLSKCLIFGNSDLVRVCLLTVVWLSSSLASLSNQEFQLYAFSVLISPLKKCLEHGELVEQKILASLSLLNFSKIPECRSLMMNIGEEIYASLENLAEVTWTAKELCSIFFGERR